MGVKMIKCDNGVFEHKGTGLDLIADISVSVFAVRDLLIRATSESKREDFAKRYEHVILSVLASPYDADESQAAEFVAKALKAYKDP